MIERVLSLALLSTLLVSCAPATAVGSPALTSGSSPTAARPIEPTVATARPSATPAARFQTYRVQLMFDTAEAEETVQRQIGALPGEQSVVLTRDELTVRYDANRVRETDLITLLRATPNVELHDEMDEGH